MWWREQNMIKPIVGPDGKQWEFLAWYHYDGKKVHQKIFFWDSEKQITGILELRQSVSKNKLKDKMKKLALEEEFRKKHLCELRFPIEKYY